MAACLRWRSCWRFSLTIYFREDDQGGGICDFKEGQCFESGETSEGKVTLENKPFQANDLKGNNFERMSMAKIQKFYFI